MFCFKVFLVFKKKLVFESFLYFMLLLVFLFCFFFFWACCASLSGLGRYTLDPQSWRDAEVQGLQVEGLGLRV